MGQPDHEHQSHEVVNSITEVPLDGESLVINPGHSELLKNIITELKASKYQVGVHEVLVVKADQLAQLAQSGELWLPIFDALKQDLSNRFSALKGDKQMGDEVPTDFYQNYINGLRKFLTSMESFFQKRGSEVIAAAQPALITTKDYAYIGKSDPVTMSDLKKVFEETLTQMELLLV